ncbi:hypothetical protein E2562_037660 [Oryza meyeriana var. granulata]|uniref:RING-type E3 ubiquitin transferase n=1 Tax=Oryza meyeriana var. granulata TaxID=110450 RepID=A0A6G1BQ33_9ORYZ|nr:hypothetical protein E2562_037660 [Oryza meyeriana var. granulata]
MDVPRRSSGAWEVDLVQPGPGTARPDRCSRLLLLWSVVTGVVVVLYVFVGYVWASVATAVLLAAACWFTWYYFGAALEPLVLPYHHRQPAPVDGGLIQEDIEAIPEFQYRRGSSGAAAAVEQCAVCIAVVKDGDTLRRLPACGHAFHAPCVDEWLREHATCPMCRADVKVAGEALAAEAPPL